MTTEEKLQALEREYKELNGRYQSLLAKQRAYETQPDMESRAGMEMLRIRELATFYKRMYDLSNTLKDRTFPGQDEDNEQIQYLKKQLRDSRITIEYLKAIINEKLYLEENESLNEHVLYEIFMDISKNNGLLKQAKTDDESRQRIKDLYANGVSIRQIAKMESLSVGLVHKVIHSNQPTEEE